MTCDEYRSAIAAEPGATTGALETHAAECAACAAFARSMLSLDGLILKALQVDVPELRVPELPSTEESSNVVRLPARRLPVPLALGLAASIVLATVLVVRSLAPASDYPSLESEILAHLDHEQGALTVTTEAEAGWRIDNVIGPYAQVDSSAGLISYARTCVIDGHAVPHLVLQGESGPVTLILLPDEKIDAARPIEGESVRGVILPVGDGSIAIISDRDAPLAEIQERVIQSMQWRT